MELRTATRAAGLLGGACWLARYALDAAGHGDGALSSTLYWLGLALVAVALLDLGTGLVSRSATWLRAVVAVAFPLLVWSVLEAMAPGTDPSLVDALFGGALLLLCVQQLVRGDRRQPTGSGGHAERGHRARRSHGSHAR